MAREREFDEASVLERAADLFALHGYHGTSLSMLLDATGLGKQSLYNSFGDKRALYLRALDCAAERYAGIVRAMRVARSGRAAVQVYFDRLVDALRGADEGRRRCLVTVGLMEGLDDAAVGERLRAKWIGTRDVLREAIERGQADGSIRNPAPPAVLADYLVSVVGGLRVSGSARTAPDRIARIAALSLSVLDQE